MPFAYFGAPSTIVSPFAYPGEPYAPYGVQQDQIVNPGVTYPAHMLHKLLSFLIFKLIRKVQLSIKIFLVQVKENLLNISC